MSLGTFQFKSGNTKVGYEVLGDGRVDTSHNTNVGGTVNYNIALSEGSNQNVGEKTIPSINGEAPATNINQNATNSTSNMATNNNNPFLSNNLANQSQSANSVPTATGQRATESLKSNTTNETANVNAPVNTNNNPFLGNNQIGANNLLSANNQAAQTRTNQTAMNTSANQFNPTNLSTSTSTNMNAETGNVVSSPLQQFFGQDNLNNSVAQMTGTTVSSSTSTPWYEALWNEIVDFGSWAWDGIKMLGATIVQGQVTVLSAILDFVELVVEGAIAIVMAAGGAQATIRTFLWDLGAGIITGDFSWTKTKGLWSDISVATKAVLTFRGTESLCDMFYQTAAGEWLDKTAAFRHDSGVAKGIKVGTEIVGMAALSIICPPAGALVAGVKGFAEGGRQAFDSGSGYGTALIYGTFKGGISAAVNLVAGKGGARLTDYVLGKVATNVISKFLIQAGTKAVFSAASATILDFGDTGARLIYLNDRTFKIDREFSQYLEEENGLGIIVDQDFIPFFAMTEYGEFILDSEGNAIPNFELKEDGTLKLIREFVPTNLTYGDVFQSKGGWKGVGITAAKAAGQSFAFDCLNLGFSKVQQTILASKMIAKSAALELEEEQKYIDEMLAKIDEVNQRDNTLEKIEQWEQKYIDDYYAKQSEIRVREQSEFIGDREYSSLSSSEVEALTDMSIRHVREALADAGVNNESINMILDNYLSAKDFAIEKAATDNHFLAYDSHGVAHVIRVANMASDIARQLSAMSGDYIVSLSAKDINNIFITGLVHDTGMLGDSSLTLTEIRENHSTRSAYNVFSLLEESQFYDRDEIALLAFAHSKSGSGIRNQLDKSSWEKAIMDLYEYDNSYKGAVENYLMQDGVYTGLTDETLKRLNTETLAIRLGDAGPSKTGFTQSGNTVMVTSSNLTADSPDLLLNMAQTGILDLEDGNTKDIELIAEVLGYNTMINGESIDISDRDMFYSARVKIGEGNVGTAVITSNSNTLEVAIPVLSDQAPICTWEHGIEEKLGELNGAGGINKKVTIVVPKEYSDISYEQLKLKTEDYMSSNTLTNRLSKMGIKVDSKNIGVLDLYRYEIDVVYQN